MKHIAYNYHLFINLKGYFFILEVSERYVYCSWRIGEVLDDGREISVLGLRPIRLVGRAIANGPGDRGSIPRRVIWKIKKVLDTSLLNNQALIKGKMEQSRKRNSAPFHTPKCSSYWKSSFRVALDYDRQLYLLLEKGKKPFTYELYSTTDFFLKGCFAIQ